jgi:RND family efflux transporter MFP subunit
LSISTRIRNLPNWAIPVGTSVLLLAFSMGVVHFESSGGADGAGETGAAQLELREAAGGHEFQTIATLAPDSAGGTANPATDWSKWGESEGDDLSWAGGQEWPEESEVEELSSLDCVIEPHTIVAIRSPVIGMIDAIHFERSDLVEAGQVLVELESGEERATVDLASLRAAVNAEVKSREAALDLSKRRRQRARRLYASKAMSLDLREELETEAELARFELQHAADEHDLAALEHRKAVERLNRRTIKSPISGVVIERLMSAGEVVDDEVILRVAQIDPLRVEIVLPAESFGSIKPGTKVAVIPEIPGDEVQLASVTVVDRVIDAASGTFGARVELPNPDGAIPSGLHCRVRFLDE